MKEDREVKRLRIRTRLLSGLLAIVVLMSAVAWMIMVQCKVVRHSCELLEGIDTVERVFLECRRQEKNFLLRHDQPSLDLHAAYFDTLLSTTIDLEAQVSHLGMGSKLALLREQEVEYQAAFQDLKSDWSDGSGRESERLEDLSVARARGCHALVAEIKSIVNSKREAAQAMLRMVSILSIVVGLLLSLLIAGQLTRQIVRPLEYLRGLADKVSTGDIQDVDVEFSDMEMKHFSSRETYDLARSLQRMVTSLRLLVSSERGLMDDYHMTILVLVNKAVGPGGWAVIERARASAGFDSFSEVQPDNLQRFLDELGNQVGALIPSERTEMLSEAIKRLKR